MSSKAKTFSTPLDRSEHLPILLSQPTRTDENDLDCDNGCSDFADDIIKPSVIEEKGVSDVSDARDHQNRQALEMIRNLFPALPVSWADENEEEEESFYSATTTPTSVTPAPVIIATAPKPTAEVEVNDDQKKNEYESDRSGSLNSNLDVEENEDSQTEHLRTVADLDAAEVTELYQSEPCMCNACKGKPFYKLEDFRSDLEGNLDLSYMGRYVASQHIFTPKQLDEFSRRVSVVKEVVLELEPHNCTILEDLNHWLACKEPEAIIPALSAHANICLSSRSYLPAYEYGRALSAERYNPYGNAPKRFNEMSSTFFRKNLISGKREAQWWYLYYMPSHFKMLGHSDLPTILEENVLLNVEARPNIAPEVQILEEHNFLIHEYPLAESSYLGCTSDFTFSPASSSTSGMDEHEDATTSAHPSTPPFTIVEKSKSEAVARIALDDDLSAWYKPQNRTWNGSQDDVNLLMSRWKPEPISQSRRPSPRPPARSFPTYARTNSNHASGSNSSSTSPEEEIPDTSFNTSTIATSASTPPVGSIVTTESTFSPPEVQVSVLTAKPLSDLKVDSGRIAVKERRTGMGKAVKNLKQMLKFSRLKRKPALKK